MSVLQPRSETAARPAEVSGGVVPAELARVSLGRPAGRPEAAGPRSACGRANRTVRLGGAGELPTEVPGLSFEGSVVDGGW